eukprot:7595012-Alexandrium_andersonii.AAC.1
METVNLRALLLPESCHPPSPPETRPSAQTQHPRHPSPSPRRVPKSSPMRRPLPGLPFEPAR